MYLLDKARKFQSCYYSNSSKQDLVISAYKPNGGFEERFQKEAKTEGAGFYSYSSRTFTSNEEAWNGSYCDP